MSYGRLAQEIGLSESSIKRLFSEETFSLKRLEEICGVLDLNFFDLVSMSRKQVEQKTSLLTLKQEEVLAENPKLLSYFYLLINGWEPIDIMDEFDISQNETDQCLLILDECRLIELHANNKVRLLTFRNITWRKEGPIRKRYEEQAKQEFLEANFEGPPAFFTLETGELSEESMAIVSRKLNKLIKEYNELIEIDNSLSLNKRAGTGLMIAFRPWVFSLLSGIKK